MSRCWLALVEGPVDGADAVARAFTPDGHPAGTLAAWRRRAKPVRESLRVDERLIDPDGTAAWISLVLPPLGVRLPFDDPAVQQARRLVLLHPFPAAVSTLLRDDSHFEGAITVAHSAVEMQRLREDPFARIFPSMAPLGRGGDPRFVSAPNRTDDRALRQRESVAMGPVRLNSAPAGWLKSCRAERCSSPRSPAMNEVAVRDDAWRGAAAHPG